VGQVEPLLIDICIEEDDHTCDKVDNLFVILFSLFLKFVSCTYGISHQTSYCIL
jgi:hypothetical protein